MRGEDWSWGRRDCAEAGETGGVGGEGYGYVDVLLGVEAMRFSDRLRRWLGGWGRHGRRGRCR